MRGVEQIPFLYDAMCAFLEWRGLEAWRRWLVAAAKGRVLDVGCGTGRNLPLFPEGARVVGVDPSRDNLARARRRAPDVPLVQASAEALPFRPGVFDTAISGFVFCSVPDPMKGLAEVRRVLAPGGVLRMLEHVRSRSPRWARFQDFIQPAWTRVAGGCHPNRDTEANVERAGFRIDPDDRRARDNTRRFQARPAP